MATFLILHSPSPQFQCVSTTFSWEGGIPPYTLRITADSSAGIGDTLQTFAGINGMSLQWPANLPGGTQFGIVLRDATPITVQFEPVTMGNGTDSSCLGNNSSSSSLGTTSASQTSTSSTVTSDTSSTSTTAQSSSSSSSGTSAEIGSNTGTPGSVLSGSSTSLSPGAIAGIAVGAALGGCLCAVVGFWLWKRARTNRRRRNRMTAALNESTLTPWQPPPEPSSKAAAMRESLLSTAPASSQGHMLATSPSPTSGGFARYPSGVSNAYSSELYPATPHTPPSPNGTGEGHAYLSVPSGGRARYSAVGSISTIGEESPSVYSSRLVPVDRSSRRTVKSRSVSSVAPSAGVRVSVQESDAGVRLAGGPPPVAEREEMDEGGVGGSGEDEGAPVPPPYYRYD